MTSILYIDFETFSRCDLKKRGLYNYARDPSTDIFMLGYAFDEEDAVWCRPDAVPQRVYDHVRNGGKVVAHNAPFELALWNEVLKPRYGAPWLQPKNVICTAAMAYSMSLPGSLAGAGKALGLDIQKDEEGHTLMMRMCRPNKHGKFPHEMESFTFLGKKVTPAWAINRLGEYCVIDVGVERRIFKRASELSGYEKVIWRMDYAINNRGVPFDMEAVEAAIAIRDMAAERINDELTKVSGGAIQTATAVGAIKRFCGVEGALGKAEIDEVIAGFGPGSPQRRVLELRKEAGRLTSAAKLDAIKNLAGEDGRVRNVFQYHGAGTGRWAGRGIQPHNLTRDLPDPEMVEEIMEFIKRRDIDGIDMIYGSPLTVISKLLRAFIVPEGDSLFIGGDFSNVEGRGLAWLAGEDWKLDAFRKVDSGDAPDIYVASYADVFETSIDEARKNRQTGKVIELAFGYQGGAGAARAFGFKGSDDEIELIKNKWRSKHAAIVRYWRALQNASIAAVNNPKETYGAGHPSRRVLYRMNGSFLTCRLPSGRRLFYPYPEIREGGFGPMLTYKTVPSQQEWQRGQVIADKGNARNWARVGTYGGKLSENVTQAVCRDILADNMLRAEKLGYGVSLHVHDEVVVEGAFHHEDRARIERLMRTPPAWAKGFPLMADCWMAARYQK